MRENSGWQKHLPLIRDPWTISLPPLLKAIACPFIHFTCTIQINMAVLGLPGGSGACHLLSPPLFSSVLFLVLIAPPESQRGLYVRFYLQRRTGGKLNEAWTWEQPHLSFSRGCSEHIKGNISNVQNKWGDVKTPKDFPPPATLSHCHKSQDPCAHCCIQTGEETLSRARFLPHGYSVTVTSGLFISTLNSKCGLLVVSLPKAFQTWCAKQLERKLKQLSILAVRRVFLPPSMTVCL